MGRGWARKPGQRWRTEANRGPSRSPPPPRSSLWGPGSQATEPPSPEPRPGGPNLLPGDHVMSQDIRDGSEPASGVGLLWLSGFADPAVHASWVLSPQLRPRPDRRAGKRRWRQQHLTDQRGQRDCGHGFRSFEHYRLRVLLHAGGITWPNRPRPHASEPALPTQTRRARLIRRSWTSKYRTVTTEVRSSRCGTAGPRPSASSVALRRCSPRPAPLRPVSPWRTRRERPTRRGGLGPADE